MEDQCHALSQLGKGLLAYCADQLATMTPTPSQGAAATSPPTPRISSAPCWDPMQTTPAQHPAQHPTQHPVQHPAQHPAQLPGPAHGKQTLVPAFAGKLSSLADRYDMGACFIKRVQRYPITVLCLQASHRRPCNHHGSSFCQLGRYACIPSSRVAMLALPGPQSLNPGLPGLLLDCLLRRMDEMSEREDADDGDAVMYDAQEGVRVFALAIQ